MKNWKRLLALLLSGVMALSLFACNAGDDSNSPEPDPSEEASADPDASASPEIEVDLTQGPLEFSAGMSATDAVLTVNGQDVPADIFLYMLAMNCMNMQSYLPYFGMTLSDVADTVLEESVSTMVYHVLIRQKAAELGCLLTDAQTEEIRTALEEADLDTNITPYWGMTRDSAEFFFAMSAYYNNVLEAATHEPTTEELDQYIADAGVFAVKHILLKTTDDSNQPLSDDEIAGKRATAEDLLSQLQAAQDMPVLFDQLMNEYSEDGGLATNPDGYVFSAEDSLVDGFREAALELDVGSLSGIVETDYGYHIMLRLPLSDDTRDTYKETYRYNALDEIIAQWQSEAAITRADALGALDIASFYDRLAAYQQAVDEQQSAAEDGVG